MPTKTSSKRVAGKRAASRKAPGTPRCGLCGKRKKLTKTPCCQQWICNDADQYVLFSYARNSCYRNHDRLTLCSYHFHERHGGDWRACKKCRKDFETEMYVHYGTNEYNFVKLENPPAFEPTRCSACNRVINLGHDGYIMKGGKYYCTACRDLAL